MLPTKPFVGVIADCCSVYVRLYPNSRGDRYEARCPKCSRRIEARASASRRHERPAPEA